MDVYGYTKPTNVNRPKPPVNWCALQLNHIFFGKHGGIDPFLKLCSPILCFLKFIITFLSKVNSLIKSNFSVSTFTL